MKFDYPSVNISHQIAYVLSAAIAIKLILTLRNIIPARVNCWFCNSNFWVPYSQRNSWDCRHCEQYNGFTKDGDYNKNLFGSSENPFVPKNVTVFKTPPKNGLCKMCNINQELKVFQLANFVPMNENNFDDEVDSYRSKLEEAYKLCSPCRKHVRAKLQIEKSKLLDTKVGESRSPKKMIFSKPTPSSKWNIKQNIARVTLISICLYLFCMATLDAWTITDGDNMKANISQGYKFLKRFAKNIFSIVKDKAFTTMPILANYEHLFRELPSLQNVENITLIKHPLVYIDWHMMEKLLSAVGCILQITCHCWQINIVRHVSTSDVVWAVNILSTLLPMQNDNVVLLVKFLSTISLLTLYSIKPLTEKIEEDNSSKTTPVAPKKIRSLTSLPTSKASLDSLSEDDDSGDDVSLCKFGLNNTDTSNETKNSPNKKNGRTFSPFNRSTESLIWTPQKNINTGNQFTSPDMQQSAFVKPQPHFSTNDNIFKTNPEGDTYRKPSDYDADLDRSISGLNLGNSRNNNRNNNRNIFTMQRFSCPTPTFVSPSTTSLSQGRPLISPSRFCAGTSWVAGGYWGSNNPSFPDEHLYSRSSSQSSGFESLASSMQHINMINSCPPSATDSICSDMEYCDPSRTAGGSIAPQKVPLFYSNSMRPPVHPQLLFNNHVQIPQLPQQTHIFAQSNGFVHDNMPDWRYNKMSNTHTPFTQRPSQSSNPVFTSRLIKLPNVKS